MLAPAYAELVERAEEAAGNAYAPYSGLRVGSAVRATSGRIYTGCNVENASYPVSLCAERSAVAAAVCAGEESLGALAVSAVAEGYEEHTQLVPCGMCRQFIWEIAPEADIVYRTEGRWVARPLAELLPKGFTL